VTAQEARDRVPPRVTIVIPCHNLGAYLDEAVQSALDQTFPDFDIVVVDDGSTDEATRRLLADYRRPRTRVIRQAHRGLPAARNRALAETEATYICALDADDRLAPTYLERSVAVLDADPSLAFASHWVRTFGDEVTEWRPERCDLAAVLDMNTINGAALVRREALLAVGGWDESMREGCEDWDLWLRLLERGYRGTIIPEVLFYYRRRPGSMSRVMMATDVQLGVFGHILAKHRESYRRHLGELVERRERDIARLAREIYDLDLDHAGWLLPEIARAEEEREALEAKARRVAAERAREAELERLAARVAALEHEVADLRRSWSWRVTAPLRAVYGWWLAHRGRR
jgi:glycosyltransferase involved in cell wall biosynthesis